MEGVYRTLWQRWCAGDALGAEAQLRVAVQRYPGEARLRLFYAACVASHRSDTEADAAFEPLVGLAARTNQRSREAQVAEYYLHLGDPELVAAAFAGLARCFRESGSDPLIAWIYAQAALRVGRPNQAVRAFRVLLDQTSHTPGIVRQAYAAALDAEGLLAKARRARLAVTQEFSGRMPNPRA